MNVTSIEWRGQEPPEDRPASSRRRPRRQRPADCAPEDLVEIHTETLEEALEDPVWLDDLA
jgi:hypothetical protein